MGRSLLHARVYAGPPRRATRSRSITLWATHLRWAALCPEAWRITTGGHIPFQPTPPPIVEECKEASRRLEQMVRDALANSRNTLAFLEPRLELTVEAEREGEQVAYHIISRPDALLLYNLGGRLVNLVVEATLRSPHYTPLEWLAAEALAAYYSNLLPTIILLVRPEETIGIPLTTELQERLLHLLHRGPRAKPTPQLCANCDLRGVCPNPLV